ncbi:MAG TPA: S41 family peptidase [Thermoanaerobaculia bacterium]|nr:S41 family peptidase [Thermoanaerobaculia bacterium]
MRRSFKIVAITAFASTLAVGGLWGNRLLALTDEARDGLRLYTELVTIAHERYGADVTYKDLVFSSVQGMLRILDPHTNFLPPDAYTGMREKQQASFYGLGILVGSRNGQLTVISPLEGTPASRMGIQAGDVISTIEGEPTDKMGMDEAVSKLKGPKGTQVKITVVRRGLPEPLAMSITRAEIPQTTVRQAYMLTPDTGYIQLSEFARSTGKEMEDAIQKLKVAGMKRLLVDLRNNGGGLLDQAIEVAEQFLPEGATIVETRGRTRDSFQSYEASSRHQEIGLPVVVLVNEGTASAAEILSGAIQDHDVGLVVGTPSWGKGLVQTVYTLSYGAGLALTTAKYYTPSGRLIQRDYSSYYDYYAHADAPAGTTPEKAGQKGQIFHTDLGREVYGAGGITPDVTAEPDKLTPFEQFLLARNAYVNFALDYHLRHKAKSIDWQPEADVVDAFRAWLIQEKVATPKELDEGLSSAEAREFARLQIRAEVLNVDFGQEARSRVLSAADKQIAQALEQFGKAAQMLAQRRSLNDKDKRAVATTARR